MPWNAERRVQSVEGNLRILSRIHLILISPQQCEGKLRRFIVCKSTLMFNGAWAIRMLNPEPLDPERKLGTRMVGDLNK